MRQTVLVVGNCGHCGKPFLQNLDPQRQKTYCSKICRDNAQHMRQYYSRKVWNPAKIALKLTRNQRNAAAWRERALIEGRCVRCGRENDRGFQGLKVCTNCLVVMKGGM